MIERIKKQKYLAVLVCVAALLGGCGDKDELAKVKEQLAQAQNDLDSMTRRCEAIQEDLRLCKAANRQLENQLNSLVSSADDAFSTSEAAQQNLNEYTQYIALLETQIQELNAIVEEQDAIIAEQEAAFAELMDLMEQ